MSGKLPNSLVRAWVGWFFIFVVVAILPMEVSFGFLQNIIEESSDFQIENLQIQLGKLSRSLADGLKPEFVLQPFFYQNLIKKKGKTRETFLQALAEKYPGAFQVAIWNDEGNFFPTPPSLSFSPQVPLQTVVKKYLIFGRGAEIDYRDIIYQKGGDPDLQDFQKYLGSSISLRDFFRKCAVPIEFQYSGIPSLIFWGGPGRIDRTGLVANKDEAIGYFIQIDLSKLPREFFVKTAIQGFNLRMPGSIKTLAFLDTHQLKNSFFRKKLPQSPRFARRLKFASERKLGEIFMVDSFMAMEMSAEAGPGKKAFLLLDAAPIFNQEQHHLTIIRAVSRLLLLLAFAGLVFIGRGWGRNLGLAWRIAVLLLLAILLPLGGAFWAGKVVVKELEKRDFQRMSETLRLQASRVKSRYPGFVTAYGIRLQKRIKQLMRGVKDEPELIRRMESINEGLRPTFLPSVLTSDYFLSDSRGKMSYTSMNKGRDEMVLYKVLLQKFFQENIYSGETSSGLLGETMAEEIADLGGKGGNQGLANLQLDTITKFKFARGETALLPIVVMIGGQRRILLFHFGEGLLNQHFIQHELSWGRLAKIHLEGKASITFLFAPLRDRFRNFADSSLINAPEIVTGAHSHQESSGELTWEGQQYLFFMADRELFAEYRLIAMAPTASMKEASAKRDKLLSIWFLFVLAIAFLTGSILTKKILQPIHQLDFALGTIRNGDFSVRLPSMGEDEIGQVGRNVNHMVRELREKERMQAYLSDTALQAVRDGSADRDLEAQWKEVTILFSDIRGFTTLSEKHSPEALFSALNDFFETVESHIRGYGGQVQKFIGDAAYAVFPEEGKKGALGAVAAAIEIMKFLPEFNRQREEKGLFSIAIGIGINTGRVLLGKVGSEARKDFAYIGDEVNVASALESASKQGRFTLIMLSENTWKLVDDQFRAEKTTLPAEHQGLPHQSIYEIRELK